jgi:hypothetical protein
MHGRTCAADDIDRVGDGGPDGVGSLGDGGGVDGVDR